MVDSSCDKIARMIINSKMTLALTGAGISTESGIPDFRSPGSGLWERIDPMEALSANVLYNEPEKFYSIGFKLLTSMRDAKPNKAHYILADMEKEGLIEGVITQNIDNLHHQAGSKNIMEVHGSIGTGRCLNCNAVYDLKEIEGKIYEGQCPPLCGCGGVIRTNVVLFGDNLPKCFDAAWEKSKQCDVMIVIGSSLQVSPVNYLPGFAKKLAIINSGETMYDDKADVVCHKKASSALEEIYQRIKELINNAG